MVRRNGFTLIEIMVVVAILGILASVAVVYFGKNKDDAAVQTEINNVFAQLRMAQDAYILENNTYLALSANEGDLYPPTPSASMYNIRNDAAYPTTWSDLGVQMSSVGLRCGYALITGAANDNTNVGAVAQMFNFVPPDEDWYYIIGQCDMDEDGRFKTFFTHSAINMIGDCSGMATCDE